MLFFCGGASLSPSELPFSPHLPCNKFSFTVSLLKVLSLWKQTPGGQLTTLYQFDGSLGTKEQVCSVGASEDLTLGHCKTRVCSENSRGVAVLKAGRGENSYWVSLLHARGMENHIKPKSYIRLRVEVPGREGRGFHLRLRAVPE